MNIYSNSSKNNVNDNINNSIGNNTEILTLAWDTELKGYQKFILIALANHLDEYGKCYLSINQISKKCGISRSSVLCNIKTLINLKFILKVRRCHHPYHQLSNCYQLNFREQDINKKILNKPISKITAETAKTAKSLKTELDKISALKHLIKLNQLLQKDEFDDLVILSSSKEGKVTINPINRSKSVNQVNPINLNNKRSLQ